MSLIRRQLFEFGPFRLDAQEGLLLRDGQPVSVPPKALDLLVALVSRRAIDRSGHLVHAADGALFAAPFDLETLRVTGPDVQVIRPVMMGLPEEMRMAEFAVSHTGILVYLPGPVLQTPRTLVWVNRSGREELLLAEPRWYGWPRFSPDGSRLAFTLCEGLKDSDVWIHDVVRHTTSRVTSDAAVEDRPLWTPDSKRIVYSSGIASPRGHLVWRAADGVGGVERLTGTPNPNYTTQSFTRDGTRLAFTQWNEKTRNDVYVLDMERRSLAPLLQEPFVKLAQASR